MHKIFLSVDSMIVTHFLQKAYRKITEKPTIDKDEIYRQMKKAEHEALRAWATATIAKMDAISTPRDGEKWMVSIGTVQQMRDALRPSPDQCDSMAMAPGRFA